AATLPLDPAMLTELIGRTDLAELLDPEVLDGLERQRQGLSGHRRAAGPDDLADLLRIVGPMTAERIGERTDAAPGAWIRELAAAGRIFVHSVDGDERWAVVEDAARLRDGLGVAVPEWIPPQLA